MEHSRSEISQFPGCCLWCKYGQCCLGLRYLDVRAWGHQGIWSEQYFRFSCGASSSFIVLAQESRVVQHCPLTEKGPTVLRQTFYLVPKRLYNLFNEMSRGPLHYWKLNAVTQCAYLCLRLDSVVLLFRFWIFVACTCRDHWWRRLSVSRAPWLHVIGTPGQQGEDFPEFCKMSHSKRFLSCSSGFFDDSSNWTQTDQNSKTHDSPC